MPINDINGVAFATNISKVNGVSKSNIEAINSVSAPSSVNYFLDTYTGASLAFSFRQLSSSATNCIDVVNDVGAVQTIGFSSGYLDTSAISSHCGVGLGFISKWYDQSGNNRHASQSSSARRPQIYSSGSIIQVNGKVAALFDTDRLLTPSVQVHTGSFYGTCVIRTGSAIVNGQILNQDDSASSPRVRIAQYLRTGSLGTSGRVIVFNTLQQNFKDDSPALSTNTQLQISAYADSTGTLESFDNGTTNGSSSYSGTLFTGSHEVAIGSDARVGAGAYFPGHIQEIILFDGDQSSNRSNIESDIDTYYAIP